MNKVVTICTQSGFCQFHGAGQGLLFVGQGAGQGSLFFRGAGRAMHPGMLNEHSWLRYYMNDTQQYRFLVELFSKAFPWRNNIR